MEENKNDELQEQNSSENLQKDTEENLSSTESENVQEEQQAPPSNMRTVLWSLAGIYLLYTGYSLCKGVLTGAEGASTGFLIGGIAFAVIGAGLLFFSMKGMIADGKQKAKAAKDAAVESAAGGELKKDNEPAAKKSMSIAERANLTKRLEEEDEEE